MRIAIATLVLVLSTTARADDFDSTPAATPARAPVMTATVSALLPALCEGQCLGARIEARVATRTSLGVTANYGAGPSTFDGPTHFGVFGIEGAHYFDDSFANLHVGVLAAYGNDGASGAIATPFVGYKWILPVGFTFVMRGGLGAFVKHDEMSTREGLFPYAALDLGWSI
jgi:hypothetical protein